MLDDNKKVLKISVFLSVMNNYDELLRELKEVRNSIRGLAARAVVNYLITELEEIGNSINKEDLNRVLSNALDLINIEEGDILRVKEMILRLMR